MSLLQAIEQEKESIRNLRRTFHSNPELSMQEYKTAARVEEELDRYGIRHSRIGSTGVLGIIKGSLDSDAIVALRADMDALPIIEENDVPYRSTNPGVMHACGHDAHTACLLGAAHYLSTHTDSFGGEIRLIFQPGEETGEGAKDFLKAHVLDGVSRVLGIHTASNLPSGIIAVKSGLNNAAVDYFKIHIEGKSAHVSTPELGADALYIASQVVVALQALITRRLSPVDPVIIGVGSLHSGTAYNIVAGDAILEGTTRTTSLATRQWAKDQINQTVASIAAIYGGVGSVEWVDIASPVINDDAVSKEVEAVASALWPERTVVTNRELSLGGDNFAEFELEVPGAYAMLGTASAEDSHTSLPAHNGGFNIDEDALTTGAALYAGYALYYLKGGTNFD